jgi:hypothetical protein
VILAISTLLFFSVGLKANGQSRSLDFYQESRQQKTVYEDQFILCNFWNICTIINADDFMSKKSIDKLWNNFDQDLDTFKLTDAIKGESTN